MAKTRKRVLSFLMALILIMGLLPTSVLAYDDQVGLYQEYSDEGDPTGDYLAKENAGKSLENGDLTFSKIIEQKDEDVFDITLTVTTTEQLEEIPLSQDAAVILLIDSSTSMNFCSKCGGETRHAWDCDWHHSWNNSIRDGQTRLDAAKTAAKNFVDSFSQDANGGKRMIAVVKFDGNAKTMTSWIDAGASEQNRRDLKGYIDAIEPPRNGNGTNPDGALKLAYNLYGLNAVSDIASRFTILLTDGQPNRASRSTTSVDSVGNTGDSSSRNAADAASASASSLKQQRKVTLYTLAFAAANETCYTSGERWVTVGQWLESIASSGCYKNATDGDKVNISFTEISETIQKLMRAWEVDDPLGAYMVLQENEHGLSSNDNVTIRRDDSGNATGFVWNLWDEDARKGTNDQGENTYTYKLTYQVKLNTSAVGFQEKVLDELGQPTEADQYYPTNGVTKLTYILDAVDADGNLKPNVELKDAYFNVPTVKGTIPSYGYSIEFYKYDPTEGKYELVSGDTIDGGEAKLHSVVNAGDVVSDYAAKYDKYTFNLTASTTAVTITGDEEANVIKLCYDPVMTDVVVEHWYKTTTIDADGVRTEGKYQKVDNVTEKVSVVLANSTYDIATYPTQGNLLYDIDKVVKVFANDSEVQITAVGDVYRGSLSEDDNLFRVYYSRTDDQRAPASVTVTHNYTPKVWEFDTTTGKYVEKDGTTISVIAAENENLKATSTFSTSLAPTSEYSDYAFVAGSAKGSSAVTEDLAKDVASMTLAAGENTMSLDFTKAAENEPAEATLQVTYIYNYSVTTVNSDGTLNVDTGTITNPGETISAHAGDYVSAYAADITNDGTHTFTYTPASGNAAALSSALKAGANTVTLYYNYTSAPTETATVTVNHIYGEVVDEITTVYEEQPVLGEDGQPTGETEQVAVGTQTVKKFNENTVLRNQETFPKQGEALYVDQSFTAVPKEKGDYKYDEDLEDPVCSDPLAIEHVAVTNTINIYYVKDGGTDDQTDKAEVSYQHIYTTHVTGVKEGKVQTWDETVRTDAVTEGDQTVGGTYTVTPVTSYGDNDDYVCVTEEADRTITVQNNNPTIEVYYERSEDRCGEKVSYEANYIYQTYNMKLGQNADGDWYAYYDSTPDAEDVNNLTQQETGEGYVGEVITLKTDGRLDAYPVGTTPPVTRLLTEGPNVYNFVYAQYNELSMVNWTVKHHYTTVTGNDAKETQDTEAKGQVYQGTTFRASADTLNDTFTFLYYTVNGGTEQYTDPAYLAEQLSEDVQVDFYYEQDNRAPVTYSILHVYKGQDWDDPELVVENEVWQTNPGTNGKAGQIVYAIPDCKVGSDGKPLYQLESVSISNGQTGEYGMELMENQDNAIVLTYVRFYDSREETRVVVNHHYSVTDTYTNTTTDEGTYTETFTSYVDDKLDFDASGVYVGVGYQATLRLEHMVGTATYTYTYDHSTPENYTCTLAAATFDDDNVQTNNIIDIYYVRTITSGTDNPGPIDPGPVNPDPGPGTIIPDDNTPTTELPDEETPTTELPDEEPPVTEEPVEELPEEEVPLADVPATGDTAGLWVLAAGVSGLALVWLALSGKKRREDNT